MEHPTSSNRASRQASQTATLERLAYELLDAHDDTARLAAGLTHTDEHPVAVDELATWRWQAHLDYLKALQRTGREMLAHSHTGWCT